MTYGTRCPRCWGFDCENPARARVFCASLADVFDTAVDPSWREDLFALIEATPNLDWLLLTKRIGNVGNMLPVPFDFDRLYPNVWIGATIVNRQEMLRDAEKLLAVPARVRFWSVEPMLGDIGTIPTELLPDWIICGGESGAGARPMHPDWVRSLRDQCEVARLPFLFKQWGEWHTRYREVTTGEAVFRHFYSYQHWVDKASTWVTDGICLDRHGRELRNGSDFMRARDEGDFPVTIMHRVGKKAAGRLLDWVLYHTFPTAGASGGLESAAFQRSGASDMPRQQHSL